LERGSGGKSSKGKKINGANDRFYFVTLKEPE